MSKLELINSGSENENNGTEGSEAVDDQYLLAWLCKVATIHANPLFQECPWKSCPGKESSDSEDDSSKIGDTLWCSCGKCKLMDTHAENIWFLDKNEIPKSYFEGILSFFLEIFSSSYI